MLFNLPLVYSKARDKILSQTKICTVSEKQA